MIRQNSLVPLEWDQGYSSNGIAIDRSKGPLMGQRNSAAETLQGEQHKYPGDRSSRNCRVMVISRFPLPVPVSRFAWR